MSAPTSAERCEPNLTPLLDMVLQLVMFFMLCANFVMEQVNENIKLPEAIEARALDKSTANYLILNVDAKGSTEISKEVYETPGKVLGVLRDQYNFDKARAKPDVWNKGDGRSVIILRAHKDCTYKQVDEIMVMCRRAGYSDVRLRTLKVGPPGG